MTIFEPTLILLGKSLALLNRAVATGTAGTAMAVPPFVYFLLFFFTSTTILLTYHSEALENARNKPSEVVLSLTTMTICFS